MTEKLKEPVDQLKHYSSKYVWMTAKVLELFCHEICFKQEEQGSFQSGRSFVMKSLEIKPIIHIQSSLSLPALCSPFHPQHRHDHAPHTLHMLLAYRMLLDFVFNKVTE